MAKQKLISLCIIVCDICLHFKRIIRCTINMISSTASFTHRHMVRRNRTWLIKTCQQTRPQWLTPIVLATQEAEIRRIAIQNQPGPNSTLHKKGLEEELKVKALGSNPSPLNKKEKRHVYKALRQILML
jgi:hypothetical protein